MRLLSGDDSAGYARVLASRPFEFPQDHGSHPEFRSEWWYFTGNLAGADERRKRGESRQTDPGHFRQRLDGGEPCFTEGVLGRG